MMKRYVLISVLLLVVGCSTEKVIPTDSTPTRIKTDSAETQESCFLIVENKTDFDEDVLSNISIALISQFFREVNKVPLQGLKGDACVYEVTFAKTGDTTFLSFTGKNLNSYGDSKMSGADAAQQALLKALYRSQRNKRDIICADYGEYLDECSEVKTAQKETPRIEKKLVSKFFFKKSTGPNIMYIIKVVEITKINTGKILFNLRIKKSLISILLFSI